MDYLTIIILPLAIVVSFVCAGMEAGVFTLSRWKIRQQVRKGFRRAKVLQQLLENSENFLWTIVVGNTIATFVAFVLGVLVLERACEGRTVVLVGGFVGGVGLFYMLCDLLPKTLFRLYPNRLCMLAAIPFRFFHFLLSPIVGVMTHFSNGLLRWTGGKIFTGQVFTSRGELRQIMQESAHGLSSEEKVMINRVLDLQKIRVGQITIPFARFPTVVISQSTGSVVRLAAEHKGIIWPVWQENEGQQTLVGLLDVRSLLFKADTESTQPIQEFVTSALFFAEDLTVEEALRRLQKAGQRLAVVLGRDRREIGVVGVEEIFQIIFGEVQF